MTDFDDARHQRARGAERRRGVGSAQNGDESATASGEDLEERLVAEGEIAGDYLEELLDLLDFDGDIDLDVEGDRAIVSIDGGDDLDKLVGRKGEVLDALQELTRLAVHQKTGERSRLMLDIARWRRRRRDELAALGDKVARRVLESGRARSSCADDSVRAQDRPRRGGGGRRRAQRERGRGARLAASSSCVD